MKAKYAKPTCEIILLPEEEFFTASVQSFNLFQDDDNPNTGSLSFKTGGWRGNTTSDGSGNETHWFD